MNLVSVKDICGGHYRNRWLKMLVMSLIQLACGLESKNNSIRLVCIFPGQGQLFHISFVNDANCREIISLHLFFLCTFLVDITETSCFAHLGHILPYANLFRIEMLNSTLPTPGHRPPQTKQYYIKTIHMDLLVICCVIPLTVIPIFVPNNFQHPNTKLTVITLTQS